MSDSCSRKDNGRREPHVIAQGKRQRPALLKRQFRRTLTGDVNEQYQKGVPVVSGTPFLFHLSEHIRIWPEETATPVPYRARYKLHKQAQKGPPSVYDYRFSLVCDCLYNLHRGPVPTDCHREMPAMDEICIHKPRFVAVKLMSAFLITASWRNVSI